MNKYIVYIFSLLFFCNNLSFSQNNTFSSGCGNFSLNSNVDLFGCQEDNVNSPGIYTFYLDDLIFQNSLISTGNISAYNIYFYYSSNDANSAPTVTIGNVLRAASQTIWARVEDVANSCYEVVSFRIIGKDIPSGTPNDLYSCVNMGVSSDTFVFSTNDTQIKTANVNLNISHHTSLANALNDVNPLNTSSHTQTFNANYDPVTVSARIEDSTDPSCFKVLDYDLILNQRPTISTTTLESCSSNTIGTFDLTQINSVDSALNPSDYTLQYFTSFYVNISTASSYISNTPNIAYIRTSHVNSSTCFQDMTVNLNTIPKPKIETTPGDIYNCDAYDSNGNFIGGDYDLTLNDTKILKGLIPSNYTFTYFIDFPNTIQENTSSNITSSVTQYRSNTSLQNEIVRVRDNNNGCFSLANFYLRASQKPITGNPGTITICDDLNDLKENFDLTVNETLIKNNSTSPNLSVTYFENEVDAKAAVVVAGTEIQNPTAYEFRRTGPQVQSTKIIYARLDDSNTGCFSVVSFNIILQASPSLPNVISDIFMCDNPSETGIVAFNLTEREDEIKSNLSPPVSGFAVTYYDNLADARNNTASKTLNRTSYNNVNALYNPETIYARLENISTGCSSIIDFKIQVTKLPNISTTSNPISLCNISEIGTETFDLTQNESNILTTPTNIVLNPSDYTFTYINYNGDVISTPTAHNNFNSIFLNETIFVDVLEKATSCSKRSQFNIQVLRLPSATILPSDLEKCDSDQTKIGFEIFDFTNTTSEIVSNRSGFTVDYYNTLAQANIGNTGAILTVNAYENSVINTEEIYARLTDTATSCSKVYPFNISVSPPPTMGSVSNLVKCDSQGTNSVSFNFHADKRDEILSPYNISLHSNYIVSFYDSTGNASTATNQLQNTVYSVSVPSTVNIDARLENRNTGCFSTTTFSLSTNPRTNLNLSPSRITLCDVDQNGKRKFDLTTKETDILNNVTDVVNFKYFANDPTGTNPIEITNDIYSYENTTNPQSIFIEATTPSTSCYQIAAFIIDVVKLPSLPVVSDLQLCETSTPGDSFESFNLSTTEASILSGITATHSVSFYTSENAARLGGTTTNPSHITSPYTNTIAGSQTIWARLDDNNTGCFAYTSFDLKVNPLPNLGNVSSLVSCDIDGDGSETFTLGNVQKNEALSSQIILGTAADYNVIFRNSSGNVTTSETVFNSSIETITAIVENINTLCFNSNTFELKSYILPVINTTPGNIERCDNSGTLSQNFDITSKESDIKGTYAGNLLYSYHLTSSDAENDISKISPIFNSNTSSKTIYARVIDSTTGCFNIASFDLIINSLPNIPPLNDLSLCNINSSLGFEEFDLSSIFSNVNAAIPGHNISFHLTPVDASTGIGAIQVPYRFTNTIANQQSLYLRAENIATNCVSQRSFDLIVNPLPVIGTASDLEACDPNGDGKEDFRLGIQDANILNNLSTSNYELNYYTSSLNANYDANNILPSSIPTPLSKISFENTTQNQSIYVRLQNRTTNCHSNTDFKLRINPLPNITTSVPDIEVCLNSSTLNYEFDLTSRISDILQTPGGVALNASAYTVTYHLSQSDIDSKKNPISIPSKYISSNTKTIYVRVEDKVTGCYQVATFMVILNYNPVPSTTLNLEGCSSTTPGYAEFDLTINTSNIQGSLNLTTNVISYYKTVSNANSKTTDILDSTKFTNTVKDNQTVYYRLENVNTGCYTTGSFSLKVNESPLVSTVTSYQLCDASSGNLTSNFDLTLKDTEILKNTGTISAFYDIEYYVNSGSTKTLITAPKTYSSQNALIEYDIINSNTSCRASGQFNLIVNPLPNVIAQPDFVQCEEGNGRSTFDLTSRETNILGTNIGGNFTVYFYENNSDASNTIRRTPISNPSTFSGNNSKIIYARIENNTTGCYVTSNTKLIVNSLPDNPVITDMELCNVNATTQLSFDLSTKKADILGTNPSAFLVSYYNTLSDAETNASPIANLYNSSGERIYSRTENNITGCFVTNSFELKVNSIPKKVPLQNLESCEDSDSGLAIFDFSNQSTSLLLSNLGTNVTVSFHLSQSNADTGTTSIANTTSYESAVSRIIYARIEDIDTNCYNTAMFDAILNPSPTVNSSITTYGVCGDDTGKAYYDLDTKNSDVLGSYSIVDYNVIYYPTKSDAQAKTNPIPSSNNYYSSDDTVYARLENKTTNCFSTASIPLRVNAKPRLGVPTEISKCSTTPGFSEFDLTSKYDEIKINSLPKADYDVIYYPSLATAQNRTPSTEIPTNTYNNYMSASKTIYVNLVNNKTNCFATTSLTLNVIDDINTQVLSDIESCDDGTGTPVFDLTSKNHILEGLNPNNTLVFTFFESQSDLNNGTNIIPNYLKYKGSDGKKIYIKIEKKALFNTQCPSNIDIELQVNPLPPISTLNILPLCDDDFDAKATFDITTVEPVILAGLNKLQFPISYYNSENDANDKINPILSTSVYESEGETIYTRVEDSATNCFIIEPFDLVVNESPNISSLTYEVCDDDDDGFTQFDLSKVTTDLLSSLDFNYSYDISYYFSLSEAEKTPKGLALNTSFVNTIPFSQTIYYRVENTTNNCLTVKPLTANVLQLPAILTPINHYQCDDSIKDGFSIFNLDNVKQSVDENNLYKNIVFYEELSDIASKNDIKGGVFNNTIQDFQYIFATVEDSKGCVSQGIQVNLHVNSGNISNPPIEFLYQVCDDTVDNDSKNGITEFDFSDAESKIRAILPIGNYQVSFYNSEIESLKKENPILNTSSFRNISSPGKQTIFTRIENGSGVCQYLEGVVILETVTIPNLLLRSEYPAFCKNEEKPIIGVDLGNKYSYEWNTGELTPMISVNSKGDYFLKVTEKINSCVAFSNVLSFVESESADIGEIDIDGEFTNGDKRVTVNIMNEGEFEFQLDASEYQTSNIFNNVSIGKHVISVKDKRGCAISSKIFDVLALSSYFTPNGDGYNDTWSIVDVGNVPEVKIFDRFGNYIITLNRNFSEWDGKVCGVDLPASDYWYELNYIDKENEVINLKGNFTLKR